MTFIRYLRAFTDAVPFWDELRQLNYLGCFVEFRSVSFESFRVHTYRARFRIAASKSVITVMRCHEAPDSSDCSLIESGVMDSNFPLGCINATVSQDFAARFRIHTVNFGARWATLPLRGMVVEFLKIGAVNRAGKSVKCQDALIFLPANHIWCAAIHFRDC